MQSAMGKGEYIEILESPKRLGQALENTSDFLFLPYWT